MSKSADSISKSRPPILFIFDTNAHTYLADHPDFDSIIEKLNSRRPLFIPHFTFVNFFEYLKMVHDKESLCRAQGYVRKVKSITLGGSILPDVKLHVRAAAGIASEEQLTDDMKQFLSGMNMFLRIKGIDEFSEVVAPALSKDMDRVSRIVAGYRRSDEISRKVLKSLRQSRKVDSFKKGLSLGADSVSVRSFLKGAVKRFGLVDGAGGFSSAKLLETVPSIRYYSSVFLHYSRQSALVKRDAKDSDYIDMEQVGYLNVADYIVTGDRFLQDLINHCGEEDLVGRAISPLKFLDMIDDNSIGPIAPQKGVQKWVGLS